MRSSNAQKPVFVSGATGFVGQHLRVLLRAAGRRMRLGSRRPQQQPKNDDDEWVYFNVDEPGSVCDALNGCDAAYYLVHQLNSGYDYVTRERQSAHAFAKAAEAANLRRIIYLGGVAPSAPPSPHLKSRIQTGEILRASAVSAIEIRAAMIIGYGSLSWRMVRDLAARLPAMVLPKWLNHHSWPVAVDDMLAALLVALDLPADMSGCYDLPGPERISHRDVLERTATNFGRRPLMLNVPVLSPRLSSYWIRFVTDVDLQLTRELVRGLLSDLDPSQPPFWPLMPPRTPLSVDEAITNALADELRHGVTSEATRRRIETIADWYESSKQQRQRRAS